MNEYFYSKLYTKDVSLKTSPNIIFDIEIHILGSHVTMIFHYNPRMYSSHDISIAVIPLIFKDYGITIELLRKSFKQIDEKSFSLEFDYHLFNNIDSNIEEIVKSILLNNNVTKDEILGITYCASESYEPEYIGAIFISLKSQSPFVESCYSISELEKVIKKSLFIETGIELICC